MIRSKLEAGLAPVQVNVGAVLASPGLPGVEVPGDTSVGGTGAQNSCEAFVRPEIRPAAVEPRLSDSGKWCRQFKPRREVLEVTLWRGANPGLRGGVPIVGIRAPFEVGRAVGRRWG